MLVVKQGLVKGKGKEKSPSIARERLWFFQSISRWASQHTKMEKVQAGGSGQGMTLDIGATK